MLTQEGVNNTYPIDRRNLIHSRVHLWLGRVGTMSLSALLEIIYVCDKPLIVHPRKFCRAYRAAVRRSATMGRMVACAQAFGGVSSTRGHPLDDHFSYVHTDSPSYVFAMFYR